MGAFLRLLLFFLLVNLILVVALLVLGILQVASPGSLVLFLVGLVLVPGGDSPSEGMAAGLFGLCLEALADAGDS